MEMETLEKYAVDLSRRGIITAAIAERLIALHRQKAPKPRLRNCDKGNALEQYEAWLSRRTTCRECGKFESICRGNNLICLALWLNEEVAKCEN